MDNKYDVTRDVAYRQALASIERTEPYRRLQLHKAILDGIAERLERINLADAEFPDDNHTPTPHEIRISLISFARRHKVEPHERLWRDPVRALEGVHEVQAVVHLKLVAMRRCTEHIELLAVESAGEADDGESGEAVEET